MDGVQVGVVAEPSLVVQEPPIAGGSFFQTGHRRPAPMGSSRTMQVCVYPAGSSSGLVHVPSKYASVGR
jgi:hypothetical protein